MVAGDSGTSKTGTVHYYYKCGNRKRGGKETCSLKAVRKEWLEHAVTYVAVTYVQRDEITERIVNLAWKAAIKKTRASGSSRAAARRKPPDQQFDFRRRRGLYQRQFQTTAG